MSLVEVQNLHASEEGRREPFLSFFSPCPSPISFAICKEEEEDPELDGYEAEAYAGFHI